MRHISPDITFCLNFSITFCLNFYLHIRLFTSGSVIQMIFSHNYHYHHHHHHYHENWKNGEQTLLYFHKPHDYTT